MQHLPQLLLRQSAFAYSRTIAVCSYHSQLQQSIKWNPTYHLQHNRSYSHQPKYHRCTLSSSNQLWQKHLIRKGGLLTVAQEPTGRRTKFDVEVVSTFEGTWYIPSPAEFAYEYLEYLNVSYPWWVSIAMSAAILRSILVFPWLQYQHRVAAKIENAQPEINTEAEQLKQRVIATANVQKWSQQKVEDEYGQELRQIINEIHFQRRCAPRKLFYVVGAQMGVWTTLTVAIGQMTGKYPELFMAEPDIDFLPELCTQGALWFTDLTQPSLALAIMYGIVNLTLTEMWSLRRGPLSRTQDIGHHAFRGISVGMVFVASYMPSAVTLYWLSSSLVGLAHFTLMKIIHVRRILEIPETPSEMKHPWKDTKSALRAKYSKKNKKKYVA